MIRASESHQLVAVEVRVEVVLDLYHQMLPSLPAGYEGWKLELFGHPTEGTQDWFAGNLEARPAGRIPLGWGWQGDENTGFSYSVSIVETDDGPCIELGAEGASIEQLKTCTRYFKGLKFGPV